MEQRGEKRSRPPSSGDKDPRPQKRQYEKFRDARKIAVQSSSPALASGSVDVNAFTAARSFEINALQSAMRSSKAALAQRAFQDVPRKLRRRSASHNVKRVPRPLREKAAREMISDGTKAPSKVRGRRRLAMEKKRLSGKASAEPSRVEEMTVDEELDEQEIPRLKPRKVTKGKFAHRQEDKTWLPTHLYHAKRARIESRYGFSLPITPTEKSFRPTYRASHQSGFIAFDTSYFSTLILHGKEDAVCRLLEIIVEPDSAVGGKRYSSGKRSCETILYQHDKFPQGMIGPALILWRGSQGSDRQVMIRVHPSIVSDLWEELHICAKKIGGVRVEDTRFEIGSIDLFGPTASEVLFAILKVGKNACSKVWHKLAGLGDPAALPLGAVLDLDLCDPRIEFPPRKLKAAPSSELQSLIQQWPSNVPGPATIFDPSTRATATKYLETHSRGSLQKARNELLEAGKPPTLPSSDPIIPSLLLRRDSGSWTFLLPWDWVTEFWFSIMHYPQARFGGVTEYNQICFEKKGMGFPEDWPGTTAGDEEGERRGKELKGRWQRRPEGKRESWGKVLKGKERNEVGDPFKCDWDLLFAKKETAEELDPLQKIRNQAKAAMQDGELEVAAERKHFLLPPAYAKQLLSQRSPFITSADITNALVPVRLQFIQKGNVSFRARIYRLPLDLEERQKWLGSLKKDAPKPSKNEYPPCPGEEDLLGFVTTGNMSSSEGRGRAVGALSWARVEAEERRWNEEKKFLRWCIVRDVGKDIARLGKWEVND